MKTLIKILALTSTLSIAQEMPAYMKGGTIGVLLRNGKTYTYSTDEYMVVKRGAKRAPEKVEDVENEEASPIVVVTLPAPAQKKNHVVLHGGVGRDGLDLKNNGATYEITERFEAVGGLTYCRDLEYSLGACATGLTNNTYLLGIKVEF